MILVGGPRNTHETSGRRRTQPVTGRKFDCSLGGRLPSSTDCRGIAVLFGESYEDRLFPSGMKSSSRLAALWNGHGQQFTSGETSWVENMKRSSSVSPVCVNNKGSVIIPLFEHISVCYVKLLEWAVGVGGPYCFERGEGVWNCKE
jgi:hypothetical protein